MVDGWRAAGEQTNAITGVYNKENKEHLIHIKQHRHSSGAVRYGLKCISQYDLRHRR